MTDFRHLNMRIAKNNLAYPILKDTFSVLGSSRCEVLSVLDLKDTFILQGFKKTHKDTVESCQNLVALYSYMKECLWD